MCVRMIVLIHTWRSHYIEPVARTRESDEQAAHSAKSELLTLQ